MACVLIALLTSCHTSKNASSTAPPVVLDNHENVTIEKETVTRIDTVKVYVDIPAQTAENVTIDNKSHLETDFAESDAWINEDGSLGHRLENKPQSKPADAYVPVTDTHTNQASENIVEVPVPYPEPYPVETELTKWQKIKIGSFWYLIVMVLTCLGWIFRDPIKSALKRFI